jgi:sugar lactone lactonase YvrE
VSDENVIDGRDHPDVAPAGATLGFVEGPVNAEDIAVVPGTRWLIASGFVIDPARESGNLYLIDRRARTSAALFPGSVAVRPAGPPYLETPPDFTAWSTHGIHLRGDRSGRHTLYVVHHGSRESIELFEVDATGDEPKVTWTGAIEQDADVSGNAVAPLPDGGLLATKFNSASDPEAYRNLVSGRETGNIKEWQPVTGWRDIPGTECSGPNGVDVSADGRYFFVASWPNGTLSRFGLGSDAERPEQVDLGFLPDNVKVQSDGALLVAGQEGADAETAYEEMVKEELIHLPIRVVRVDPNTLDVEDLVDMHHEEFGNAATALYVEGELWISTTRGDRIAYFF